MSKFEDDLARGCLPTGEPLECLYGMGWWTEIPEEKPAEPEPKAPGVCEACGGDGTVLLTDGYQGQVIATAKCIYCNGTGRVNKECEE